MSATLAYDDLVPQASALPTAVLTVSLTEGVTKKSGFVIRMLEAIGRSYYVPTSDGKGIYVLPPC